MGVGTLDAAHRPRVLGLEPSKKRRVVWLPRFSRSVTSSAWRLGSLGIGDARLPAEINAAQHDAIAGIGVGSDNDRQPR